MSLIGNPSLKDIFDNIEGSKNKLQIEKNNITKLIGTEVLDNIPFSSWPDKLTNADGSSIYTVVGGSTNLNQELLNVKKLLCTNLKAKNVNADIHSTMYKLAQNVGDIDAGIAKPGTTSDYNFITPLVHRDNLYALGEVRYDLAQSNQNNTKLIMTNKGEYPNEEGTRATFKIPLTGVILLNIYSKCYYTTYKLRNRSGSIKTTEKLGNTTKDINLNVEKGDTLEFRVGPNYGSAEITCYYKF